MTDEDLRNTIETVMQKPPDLVRADLASHDPSVRQSAEDVVAAKIMLAIGELRTVS